MKKIIMLTVLLLIFSGITYAQQSKSDEAVEFRPHWDVSLQGGVSYTVGEARFGQLLSPSAQLSTTCHFHHAMGVRFGLGGWQGKGAVNLGEQSVYSFQYLQFNADYILNLANLIKGFDHKRIVSPYVFAGLGAALGLNNEQAAPHKAVMQYYWDQNMVSLVGRAGLGLDFRLSECLSLSLEGNANMLSDRFNSKKADNVDWQTGILVGLSFRFGKNNRPSQDYADKVAAEEAAARALAAEKAAAEEAAKKAAAEKAAAEKAAAEKAAAEKAEAERLAAEKAAAERAAAIAQNSDNVFFTIGSSVISKKELKKVEKLASWLNSNPGYSVLIVGYADKKTGNSDYNLVLSERRANAVKKALLSAGVPSERIATDFKGDKDQPFAENHRNRVVICAIE